MWSMMSPGRGPLDRPVAGHGCRRSNEFFAVSLRVILLCESPNRP